MNIPFNDLNAQHATIEAELNSALSEVISSSQFIGKDGNRFVSSFENEFAQFTGAKRCVGCANGTDAIELSLRALNIGPGDEVIVPAQTWISTAEAVTMVGAEPVFADIQKDSFNIDPKEITARVTRKTKAIIPVHFCGLPADMDAIVKIAKPLGLRIIEDCAQAHGAKIGQNHVGTFGDCGIFSFFPAKNLGALGDAGAVISNDPTLSAKIASLRDHGRAEGGNHSFAGRNSRLDAIQAAALSVKLRHLPIWLEKRREIASQYKKATAQLGIASQQENDYSSHAYHLFSIMVEKRGEIQKGMRAQGVMTGTHYPIAPPFMDIYKKSGYGFHDFPNAATHMKSQLSLPLFPEMSQEQVAYTINTLQQVAKRVAANA